MRTSLLLPGLFAIVTALPAQDMRPEARDLLFSSDHDGHSQIYLLRAGQTEWINLSNSKDDDQAPVWSPDGTRIAFCRRESSNLRNFHIWTMTAIGSEQTRLVDDDGPYCHLSWSADGKSILFTSWHQEPGQAKREASLCAIDIDGTNMRRLLEQPFESATVSPDGRFIAISDRSGKGTDIYVADADGKNGRRLTDDGKEDGSPAFSPDGKRIAFSSLDLASRSSAIVVASVDGGTRNVVTTDRLNWGPRWSADGLWLIYTVMGKDRTESDIYAVPACGKYPPVLLLGGPKHQGDGSWRPK